MQNYSPQWYLMRNDRTYRPRQHYARLRFVLPLHGWINRQKTTDPLPNLQAHQQLVIPAA